MKGNILITVAIAGALFSGCALPERPSAIPKVPKIQKGDLQKYKAMNFEEFMDSLPLTYRLDRTREIPIGCGNITPKNKMMCNPLITPRLGDFFNSISRELERYCVAKSGYLIDRKKEMIKKYLENGKVQKAAQLKATIGWTGRSCKINNHNFFGYVRNGNFVEIYTPKFFKPVFDVFSPDPYLKNAKEKWKLNIKEFPKYFELSGAKIKEYTDWSPSFYIEEERAWKDPYFFVSDFTKNVPFASIYLLPRDAQIKADELLDQAKPIIKQILYKNYPVFHNVKYVESLSVKIDGDAEMMMPFKARTKDGKVLIFKAKEWEATYGKILRALTPLLKKYHNLTTNAANTPTDTEMINY
ncbi:MAG: hypothetical protein R3331_05335 [Sulfurospirillaceae bacterium]|nr:hypothetical protein [Sulfurospirillaceae bacterium]